MNAACWLALLLSTTVATPTGLLAREGTIGPERTARVQLAAGDADRTIVLVVALRQPGGLLNVSPVTVRVEGGRAVLSKALHLGDPDVTWLIRQPAGTALEVVLDGGSSLRERLEYSVRAAVAVEAAADPAAACFEAEPNDRWQEANPLVLGRTVYGLADDRPYFPQGAAPTEAENTAGQDWFVFDFDSTSPKLAFFALDFVDRDVPPDVRVYQEKDGKLVEYTRGIDPQSSQRERPPRPGANKFTTRVLTAGRYYVLVDACQPEYTLRTKLFDVPPYLTKEQAAGASDEALTAAAARAVRTAMDFQLLAGDSWHANTPRKGHPMDRIANPHHETSTCLGCHATHFTTQSAIGAVGAGYKVEQPFALRFLTERLANNPVPLYGYPEAVWARMIPAPANVLGRLSTIVMDFENRVDGAQRNNVHRAIAEFLKLYYDGRTTIPPDESNGNNPVSRYKVASDAWRQLDEVARRTGLARYTETRDLVATLLPMGEPAHTRDLAAQTIGLCTVDRQRFAARIQANVERLLQLQHADGHWPIKFDARSPSAEMQTGESLYALALAGLGPDHPAVRKGAIALLTAQKPFGGWLDLGPYEQFQTPFRETQWALIALSKLYPGPGTKGWNEPMGPAPAAAELASDAPDAALVAALDRLWDRPGAEVRAVVVALLGHANPLVRYAACRALARIGGPDELASAATRLGDESKVVSRAAAEAVRAIACRALASAAPGGAFARSFGDELERALDCEDDRVRRGATRVFAAHFRDVAQETQLARVLLARLADRDPVVRMQAVRGLWRWWYWRPELELREAIEDALIARLAVPEHLWVRRNLVEALYILGDENIRYLYNNWVPSLPSPEIRERVTAGQHATVNRLAEKYVVVLTTGSPLQRAGVLQAMAEFFERPVLGGRIGNDLEPMLVYGDTVGRVADALLKQMGDPDPTIRRLALEGLVAIRGQREAAVGRGVLARQGDENPEVRDWAATMSKEFPLQARPGPAGPELAVVLDDLLASAVPEARAAALTVLARLGPGNPAGAEAVRAGLRHAAPVVRAAALRGLTAFPDLRGELDVRVAVARALADDDVAARVEAIRLRLANPGLAPERALRQALEDDAPAHRAGLLAVVAADAKLAADLRLVGVVADALVDGDTGVREKALQAIQNRPALVNNPAVEEGLRELVERDNPRQKEMAEALLRSRGRSSGSGAAASQLDLAFYEAKVLPIFNALGEDGQNCIGCHRSHTILKLVPPGKSGTWSRDALLANFRATLRVVNLASPRDSLLLGKPTWEAAEEAEAQSDPTRKAHAGGVRFEPGTSDEYQTILDWINGARLRSPR
jgi:hypothetical protein